MKVKISQDILAKALDKGSVASLSKDAQEDTTNMAMLIRSVKITADNNLTIESSTDKMSVKYSLSPNKDDNTLIIEEKGCVLIPAKEFFDWVKAQGSNSTIIMSLSKLSSPETIKVDNSTDYSAEDNEMSITKIGSLKIASKIGSGASRKWELDVFDPEQRAKINFNKKGEKCFDINCKKFFEALAKVIPASDPSDYEHVMDSASFQIYKNNLYVASTDTKRCAVSRIPNDCMGKIESTKSLLIPHERLVTISKICDENDNLSFYYNEEDDKVFVNQTNLDIRLSTSGKDNFTKFPNIKGLMEKEYQDLADISRLDMVSDLKSASIVNNSSALFEFIKENGSSGILEIKASSDDAKYKPTSSKSKINNASKDIKSVWGVRHLLDALEKVIKSETIHLQVPDNLKSVKITGKDDDNFIYFSMSVNNPIYAKELQ